MNPKIAVILPCYNEEQAIEQVVSAFKAALPLSPIYVYDNNSTDKTIEKAKQAGAIVRSETSQGKDYVVKRAFADIEADIYVMADGDGTYDAQSAPKMIELLIENQLDMVVGLRSDDNTTKLYRPGHRFGNRLLTNTIAFLFHSQFSDVLSGFRVFSKRFVKSFPALATGFEIEAMLTIHALELRLPTAEVETLYFERVEGTTSKLRTYKDGFKILLTILSLFKEIRPFAFFGFLAILFVSTSIGLMIPSFFEFLETGLVPCFPTAILSTGLMIVASILITCGLILDSISLNRLEQKRLIYLQYSAPQADNED
ncbi:glycosyltransferase [Beggiatoa sp. PS]|nr:glycosyltransferase [Beggiatoa sp. PS]